MKILAVAKTDLEDQSKDVNKVPGKNDVIIAIISDGQKSFKLIQEETPSQMIRPSKIELGGFILATIIMVACVVDNYYR